LKLRAYFHCGGNDAVVRNNISNILTTGTVTVQYFFQDLQGGTSPAPQPGGAFKKLTDAEIAAAFRGVGDLAGSNLDPNDDYYLSDDTAFITTGVAINTLKIAPGVPGTWRVLTVIFGVLGADKVSAFDDKLVIQVIP
jgi:hypothetical protein